MQVLRLALALVLVCHIDFGAPQRVAGDTVVDDGPVDDADVDDGVVDDGFTVDLSAFRDFKIDRQHLMNSEVDPACVSGLSYGSDDGDLLLVHISEVSGGGQYLRYKEFEFDLDQPECLNGGCLAEATVVARPLSDAEVAQLRDLFRSVRVDSHRLGGPGCASVGPPCS